MSETLAEYNERMNALADKQFFDNLAHDPGGDDMPHIGELIKGKFLGTGDIKAPTRVTVRAIVPEQLRSGESKQQKYIIYFDELPKGLPINRTILKVMAAAFGEYTEQWVGKRVRLYVDATVEFAGRTVGGVRVQVPRGAGSELGYAIPQTPPAGARFDPMTGQPLATPAAQAPRFDPMTGAPLTGAVDTATGEIRQPVNGAGGGRPPADPEFDDDIPF